jgi:hypothetical protein
MAGLVGMRNERFWQQIESELAKGGVLVAVGNLHLLGEGGLAQRLAGTGFTVSALDPGRLRVPLDAEQVPALTGWVRDWVAREDGPREVGFAGLRIEPRSVVSLRRLRCPGQRCRMEGTYLGAEQRIILEMGIYARLLAGGAMPLAEFRDGALVLSHNRAPRTEDNATAYAESILVRELARHALHGSSVTGDGEPPDGPDARCRDSRTLHRASLAQAGYLGHRGVSARAHVFPVDPRCDR